MFWPKLTVKVKKRDAPVIELSSKTWSGFNPTDTFGIFNPIFYLTIFLFFTQASICGNYPLLRFKVKWIMPSGWIVLAITLISNHCACLTLLSTQPHLYSLLMLYFVAMMTSKVKLNSKHVLTTTLLVHWVDLTLFSV